MIMSRFAAIAFASLSVCTQLILADSFTDGVTFGSFANPARESDGVYTISEEGDMISWGKPINGSDQSYLRFVGDHKVSSGSGQSAGLFEYHNGTQSDYTGITSVTFNLSISDTFDGPIIASGSAAIQITNTPNTSDPNTSADYVTIAGVSGTGISGSGHSFHVLEGQTASAGLGINIIGDPRIEFVGFLNPSAGGFVDNAAPAPEISSVRGLVLGGISLLAIGGMRKRRRVKQRALSR